MENTIITLLHNYEYLKIPSTSLQKIYKLLTENITFVPSTDIELFYMGFYYELHNNSKNALHFYKLSISKNNTSAMYNLGYYNEQKKEYVSMLRYYLMAIRHSKHNKAMYNLGNYYKKCNVTDLMIKYYLMAIENGNLDAMVSLALYYKMFKKYDKMIKYYSMAIAKNGPVTAYYGLGSYYFNNKKYEDGEKYLLVAAEKGHLNSMCMLGQYYYHNKKYDLMMKYYTMGINFGSDIAMNNLGYYYYVINKFSPMKKYFKMAIHKKNASAMNNLAVYYENKGNIELMKKLYLIAIKFGSISAMNNLGHYYYKVKKYGAMKKYYSMAVNKKSDIAMNILGEFYRYYTNDAKGKALKYFLMSSKHGNHRATNELILYYETMCDYDSMLKYCLQLMRICSKRCLVQKKILYYYNEKFGCSYFNEKFFEFLNLSRKYENGKMVGIIGIIAGMYYSRLDVIQSHFEYMPGSDKFVELGKEFGKNRYR